jgi:hypothetical protein
MKITTLKTIDIFLFVLATKLIVLNIYSIFSLFAVLNDLIVTHA